MPPRTVKMPMLHQARPYYMHGQVVTSMDGEESGNTPTLDHTEPTFEEIGIWSGPQMVEHNAGRCKTCKCDDFKSLKYELMICAKCGHDVKDHVMNSTRIPRKTDPIFMPDPRNRQRGLTTASSTSAKFNKGRVTYANGGLYEGEYRLFGGIIERHGIGVMQYPNGELYSGGWRNDVRHGNKAKLVASTGEVYIGTFEDNQIVGYGTGSRPIREGSFKYIGEWLDGLRSGKGTMVSSKGDCYTGNWLMDEMSGFGEMVLSNGDTYTGMWNKGLMNGEGKHVWKNGDVYEGTWVDGEMHGNGVLTNAEGRYDGRWNRGVKEGQGRLDLPSGEVYAGTFKEGGIRGTFGVIRCKDGDTFEVRPDEFHDAAVEYATSDLPY